ncbi:MAG: glycoside hydrolase N-terminal domain-containing protein [Firmicutes bacterium]|nr:glycoside hydrolase N-terminal domain-containing protein [Bacillota bacterium]MCM1400683.1 glycoside hydrolase N-terminal domain-containing protein [Bacteroides sp.]MCM1476377.1 glycoside hydrolase N-terminal domain-containing protein [Bacteroides sp.]
MNFKFLPFLAGMVLCTGIATQSVQAADYCQSGTMTRSSGDRGMNSFQLTDGTSTLDVSVNQSKSYGSATYFDKTTNVLTVQPGSTISFSEMDWTGAWMHGYVYVDYDNDGTFNTTVNADGTTRGELVAYSYYNTQDRDGASAPNSRGVSASRSSSVTTQSMPNFTIPADLEGGEYRMRVKVDWNSIEPCGSSTLRADGGSITDVTLKVLPLTDMTVSNVSASHQQGQVAPGRVNLPVATVTLTTNGTLNPISATGIEMQWKGNANVKNLRWVYSTNGAVSNDVVATVEPTSGVQMVRFDKELAYGNNYFILLADVAEDAVFDTNLLVNVTGVIAAKELNVINMPATSGIVVANIIDYTLGNALWFNTPVSSTTNTAIWNRNDFSTTDTNPDQLWERQSFPFGNGSFGGNVLGCVNRERVVLNEKTLWMGGPGTGASTYWDMNNTVSDATLASIRSNLANGNTTSAHSLVSSNYKGKIDYNRNRFGVFTTMGEAYVSTGITEGSATNYKRIVNMDRGMIVVEFESDGTKYQRRYFASYPDSVMVWRYTSEGAPQNLTFSLATPQTVNSVTSPADGTLLYNGKLSNNNMQWALQVFVRTNDGGTVTANPTARTITVSGSNDVEFILAGDTDYAMNFDPSFTDPATYVGVDPVASVNAMVEKASAKSWEELYDNHYADYSELFNRVELQINPSESFDNLPTPTRLANYRKGTLDHELEQQYFQYGRYLLISSSRAGNMPANLQGMWHNNLDGPWRVDYHNNINLQMNYWPATCTNLLECFTPFIDYVRGLVKPGERTATAYYGARGWTAEVSTNIFGFTAPLNSTDMSWNYNPTAGPWLATQIWEYYDYTRDKEWLREIGYPIIKSSANFVSDLLYMHNGTYTSAPSYSPEHGTADLGATYANAVTREVLSEAIAASEILNENPSELNEWKEKLEKMYPYQVGRYGQLQEWYNDIDTYNDTHRHTNHLFGLHPGTSINSLKDADLVAACKETLKQRGDEATGWSMGWKLNHWARLLDGDHAYILFQNLLKNGTADNMWDLHPPFQIDGNFGGTAGVSELFLQSHNGVLHLLPALPSEWTDGKISGLRTRGNFTVDVVYAGGKLDHAIIVSNAGEHCKVLYNGKETEFDTQEGATYRVNYNSVNDELSIDDLSGISTVGAEADSNVQVSQNGRQITVTVSGPSVGKINIDTFNVSGQKVKGLNVDKNAGSVTAAMNLNVTPGVYFLHVEGEAVNQTKKLVIK